MPLIHKHFQQLQSGLTAPRKLGFLFNKNVWRGLTLMFVCLIQNIFHLAMNNIGPNLSMFIVNFAPAAWNSITIVRIFFPLITYDSCKIKAECIFLANITVQPDQVRKWSLITVAHIIHNKIRCWASILLKCLHTRRSYPLRCLQGEYFTDGKRNISQNIKYLLVGVVNIVTRTTIFNLWTKHSVDGMDQM